LGKALAFSMPPTQYIKHKEVSVVGVSKKKGHPPPLLGAFLAFNVLPYGEL
jgi:hypothetical protein